ncbi:O-antigen ligase family protein [Rhodosalinus sp. FB01]|uniref:O-antigen ligase family protein n=1 Tax=Rhodosalinus sp. FB01 TaxID=3239194 RepID=UPI00352423DC
MAAELTEGKAVSLPRSMPNAGAASRHSLSIWVWLFIIGLIIPLFIYVGPLRLTVYRIALLVAFFPALFFWLSGRAGRIRLPDICVIVICLWSSLSMVIIEGGLGGTLETIGILWVETLGAYLLGRCYIRTPEAFFAITRLLFRIGLLLLPFALYELVSGTNLYLRLFGFLGPVYWENFQESRLGLERVQGPFAHPIHFGVFFGGLTGLFYYVLGHETPWIGRVRNAVFAVFLCFSSLSSGPLLAAMSQIIFLTWDGILKSVRSRWYIFVGLALLAFIVVDLISNRTPFHVAISYLALNEGTAYNRILIWHFGTRSIFANPLFGIGLTDNWARPSWMVDSVDMFWIVPAMRHGILLWIAYLTLFFSVFLSVTFRRAPNERVLWYKTGYLCTMTGVFMVGWTVHFWDAIFAFLMFLIASGMWMLDWEGSEDEDEKTGDEGRTTDITYTRFPAQS